MTAVEDKPVTDFADNDQKPVGYGRMLRKEDPRFIRGKGRYVDDIQLTGMLHLAILRAPVAHARLVSIDTTAAQAHPKVTLVVTGAMLAEKGLAWMPTLSNDVQAVLVTDKVRFQGQEVAFVVAEDRYSARDALELIDVEYDVLPPVIDVRTALDPQTPVIRDDLTGKTNNHCFDWEAGDEAETAAVFASADVVVTQDIVYPRVHPAPMETCGAVADYDRIDGRLTLWSTTQAPHAHRTLYAIVAGLPEHKIRVISPDIGGGFGNKVPIYPGYVCAIVGSLLTGKPVKWMEDRSENLASTGFARDYIMRGEIAATKDGKILAIRTNVLADHGAFNGTAAPVKYPAGFFGVFTGSYDLQAAYCKMTAVYTNKAPGGVAYACSFRITEAVYLVERIVECLAYELKMDPVELRLKNLLKPEQFPYTSKTGWVYDSGNYEPTMREAMRIAGYDELRREQAEKRERGELMGIGVAFFTEAVGAGPRKDMDILGLGMADGCELRIHPTGKAVVRLSVQSQGQGHETTFAQIVAEEIGIAPDDIDVVHGDTDNTPFGLGTYGSRSTPVSGAAAALVARKVREKARIIASGMLEVSVADLDWDKGSFHVKGDPGKSVTIQDIAMRAHGAGDLPEGIEGGLEAQICYNPENLTYPHGAYICVVDIDPGTARVTVRRFIAVDDCGTRINPMIIEGQVHGGLTDGVGMALMEMIAFDEDGNCLGGSLMDYLIPTALEVPDWETGFTVTPSPHHPIGAKGVGESATVGSPPAIVNAVVDALKPFGIRHADMPLTPSRVWDAMQGTPGRRYERGPGERYGSELGSVTARISARVSRLSAERVPFVHATVVRAQVPTSARAGDDAIVLSDGSIDGFVGGQCAESSVRTAALGALADGAAVLLRVLPEGDVHFPDTPGAQVVVNDCLSGGALEIFLEPVLPPPMIGIVGHSPIADAVAAMCEILGYAVSRPSAASDPGDVDGPRLPDPVVGPITALVVASHGRDELESIRAAVEAGVGHIALVASHRRGSALLDELGLTDAQRARISTPAGLEIGAQTAPEVAVSILAEVIAAIRSGAVSAVGPTAAAMPAPISTADPVCGMTVTVVADTPHLSADGGSVWFCSSHCRDVYAQKVGP